jgi:ABC-type Fe3+ transport system substrate-binding protein
VCVACYVKTFAHRAAWLEFVAYLCSKSKGESWKALYFELDARYREMKAIITREEMTKMDLKLTESELLLTAERERTLSF